MATPLTPKPAAAGPETPKKPISGKTISYVLAGLLIAAFVVSSLIQLLTSSPSKAQTGEVQNPAGNIGVKSFSESLKQTGEVIQKNSENAVRVATLARNLNASVPECNQKMREQLKGQYYVLRSNSSEFPDVNLVCQADNQWAIVPSGVSAISETPSQLAAERKSPASGGMTAAERLKARRELAYKSSAIPVHFADNDAGLRQGGGAAGTSSAATLPAGSPTGTVAYDAAARQQMALAQTASPINAGASAMNAGSPFGSPTPSTIPATSPASSTPQQPVAEPLGVQLSKYTGPRYPLFQDRILEGLLVNRIMGDRSGPIKVQITTNVYSQDSQHLLIPTGSVLLGEASKIQVAGESRIAVVFHRIIMPDGWSFLMDSAPGMDQQGAAGLTGKVNRHLGSLIGTAVMVGAIEGLADFTNVGSGGGVIQIQSGISRESSNEAMQILRNAMNKPNGVTVYEGTRVRMWVRQDQALPDYENHLVRTTIE